MAEFTEVMRQARRMCASYEHKCEQGCPLDHSNGKTERNLCILIGSGDGAIYDEIEHYVMRWAEDHPEPVYPTWNEWHRSMFPNATALIRPCEFESVTVQECYNRTCITCIDRQIPADIAAKLGIKPIKEGNHAN